MAIKLSGIISGMDTDSMIDELVSAYSGQKDSIYRQQKSLSYTQDAWKTLNTKIYKLFSGSLSNMRFSTNYSKKAVTTSSNKATISGSSSAVNGTQELQINKLAKSGYLTGAKLNGNYKGSSTMADFGVTGSTRINVSVNGEDKYVDVTSDMTVNSFVSKLKETGINASFDETNQRFFISSKESGANQDFSLSGNDAAGNTLLKSMGLYTVSTTDISAYQSYIDAATADENYISNLAKNEYLNSLLTGISDGLTAANKEMNTAITNNKASITEYNSEIAFAKSSDEAKEKSLKAVSDSMDDLTDKMNKKQEAIDAEADETKKEALQKEYNTLSEQYNKASEQYEKYNAIKDRIGSSESEDFQANIEAFETENKDLIKSLDDENKELQTTINENKELITQTNEKKKGTLAEKEEYLSEDAIDYGSEEYLSTLQKYNDKLDNAKQVVETYNRYEELSNKDNLTSEEASQLSSLKTELGLDQSSLGATRVNGEDAIITLNGAEFTSTSNSFSINGLTITANALTDPEETISVTTSTDVDGIYNMVKDFFKEYNTLINEMDSLYNAASAGSYKPLTEDEESEMSDTKVEKWEKKITDAALRKDSTLNSVTSLMKTAMTQGFEVNGKTYNLSSFGIKTLAYFTAGENEKGAYHIDGDPDDSATSGNADKLKSAIASDPDTFISFFSQLASNMYSKLNSRMASSSLSSAYTIYNDKYMTSQYKSYTSKLSDWDDKIDAMREKYEKQFAAMESAMSTLNSQQSSLASMLGS